MTFLDLVLIIALAFCIIGWISSYIARISIIYYMKIHELRMPNDAEINDCVRETLKHLFK